MKVMERTAGAEEKLAAARARLVEAQAALAAKVEAQRAAATGTPEEVARAGAAVRAARAALEDGEGVVAALEDRLLAEADEREGRDKVARMVKVRKLCREREQHAAAWDKLEEERAALLRAWQATDEQIAEVHPARTPATAYQLGKRRIRDIVSEAELHAQARPGAEGRYKTAAQLAADDTLLLTSGTPGA